MEYRAYDEDSVELDPSSPFFLDHVSRYWWASGQARGKSVLDCACGKGYGSYILSKNAASVTGIDLNSESLEIARRTFSAANLAYEQQDVFKLGDRKFDLITAFEVIEHLPPEQSDAFLAGLARALAPGGKLLISTPNHDVVLKSGSFVPEFHINNFPAAKLRRALGRHFREVRMLGQFRRRSGLGKLVFDLDFLNLRHVLAAPLKKKLAGAAAEPSVATPKPQGPARAHFENPPREVSTYFFSPGHWRQSGLTVAVCSDPIGG